MSSKTESLTKFAAKLVTDASNVSVTESAGVLWVGCDVSSGVYAPKRKSRPIGTATMPTSYLKDQIRQWAAETE